MTEDLREYELVSRVGGVRVERQSSTVTAAGVERIALLAAWSPRAVLSRSTTALIAELQTHGYCVIVCSTSPDDRDLVIPYDQLSIDDLTIVRRPNKGYDFGSWAVLMDQYGHLLKADKILVVNDSLVGPFAPLGDIIADFESTSADVWGVVESGQIVDHLQSYFRGFRYGCLAEPVMREFWQNVRVIPDKDLLIRLYEYGFTPWLRRWNFSSDCFVDFRGIVTRRDNPAIAGWQKLIDAGIPFIKRELIRRPELVADGGDIGPTLLSRYGANVQEWM